ncbi:hypothetical protein D3C87_1753110 [compost metagenome]
MARGGANLPTEELTPTFNRGINAILVRIGAFADHIVPMFWRDWPSLKKLVVRSDVSGKQDADRIIRADFHFD